MPEYYISGAELVVHVHTGPTIHGYRHVEMLRAGDVLRPTKLGGIEIAVADIPWPAA